MKLQTSAAAAAFLLLATCADGTPPESGTTIESAKVALGKVPASEVAVWQKVGSGNSPDAGYLQAVAFDEAREVVVVFGGVSGSPSVSGTTVSQDTWEWNPATSKWLRRTLAGAKPDARSGAAMVYDSTRAKFILFGGRAGSGYNLEDTWEWDPATGAWTDLSPTGGHPSARSQHSMVFEKSLNKVLLFGGGRSTPTSADGSGVTLSLGDTWEFDPVAKTWASRTVTASPSVRNDSALVWDLARNKAVLFGGLQVDLTGAAGVPKQDIWEWDSTAGTWSERTVAGGKPSQRYGHAMAFDGTRSKVLVFGGWDMSNGAVKNDLWEWEPTTGAWTQRLTGSEVGAPAGRMYASMVADDLRDRMVIVGGASVSAMGGTGGIGGFAGMTGSAGSAGSIGGFGGITGAGGAVYSPDAARLADMMFSPSPSREVWELDPVTPAFSDKTPPLDAPTSRYGAAMGFNPLTGKTCLFGGSDTFSGMALADYWEWDGTTWTQLKMDVVPPARYEATMAFDPARKSMILFGGIGNLPTAYGDTWELTSLGKWAPLSPPQSPEGRMGAGMVTDTTRNKILLFGGSVVPDYSSGPIYVFPDTNRNEVWEWDGSTVTWTNRTPPDTTNVAHRQQNPAMAYDGARQKLFVYEGINYGGLSSSYFEWDPISGGWAMRDTGDNFNYGYNLYAVYDSVRRREIVVSGAMSSTGKQELWELDAVAPTWYVRELSPAPGARYGASMVFDSIRGVVVFFGGDSGMYGVNNPAETWEYKVTGWGNGEGCTAATASQCASGFCVDGVCCEAAACTGACKSCNVAGSAGTCVLAKAGTEVAGSCDAGKACDGTGSCKTKNSVACTSKADCASGFCTDGVCCDSACDGSCVACNQPGHVGQCTPYQAGSDPQSECGQGADVCKSTCDGVGNCAYPQYSVSCGNCMTCNGLGSCSNYDYTCGYGRPDGGSIVFPIDAYPTAGIGGSIPNVGGSGGSIGRGGAGGAIVGDGGLRPYGGSGGTVVGLDGSAGSIPRNDGAAGNIPRTDGSAGTVGNDGGAGNTPGFDGSVGFGGSGGVGYGVGGSGGSRFGTGGLDGGAGDAGVTTNLKSGCSCEVGQSSSSALGLGPVFMVGGLALLAVRRRRRQR
jgi:MYXO-CTERM domain-containing protein